MSDLAVLFWIVLWIRIGIRIHALIEKLAGPGRTVEDAGSSFARNLTSIRDRIGNIPLVHLFAIRAVYTRPLYELRRACDDPARALALGDYEPLARLELAALGLHPRPTS
jgi:hypothetical protein